MVWKLCDKEERPKFICQIAVCSVYKWPDSMENNKEFGMGKRKGFHRAL